MSDVTLTTAPCAFSTMGGCTHMRSLLWCCLSRLIHPACLMRSVFCSTGLILEHSVNRPTRPPWQADPPTHLICPLLCWYHVGRATPFISHILIPQAGVCWSYPGSLACKFFFGFLFPSIEWSVVATSTPRSYVFFDGTWHPSSRPFNRDTCNLCIAGKGRSKVRVAEKGTGSGERLPPKKVPPRGWRVPPSPYWSPPTRAIPTPRMRVATSNRNSRHSLAPLAAAQPPPHTYTPWRLTITAGASG